MTSPPEEQLETAKRELLAAIERIDRSMESMRSQNSAEHGSLFSKLLHLTELMHWMRAKWQKFSIGDFPSTFGKPKHDDKE